MEWLDAMRGLAMLMVIYTHQVLGSPLERIEGTVRVFGLFMLPMFFFISGFLAVSSSSLSFGVKIRRLSRQLLLPTIVVYVIHALVYGHPFDPFDQMKGGYWFLPTLFVMDMIAFALFKFLKHITFGWKIVIVCLLIIADKLIMSVAYRYGLLNLPLSKAFQIPLFLTFLTPFLFGILTKYIEKPLFAYVYRNPYGFAILIGIFLLLCYLPFSLVGFLMVSMGTLIIFLVMKMMGEYFSSNGSIISRFLIVCGKNTLGLYLLHYFVLQSIVCHFSSSLLKSMDMIHNPLMQLVIIGFSSVVTTLITLLGIKIIKLSPVLSLLCLGQSIVKAKE